MMYKSRNYLSFFLLMLCFNLLYAQTTTVSGTVTSEEEPLLGAVVQVKGTTKGTVTDFDGNYEIAVSPSDVLVFSYIGFITQEIRVSDNTRINVILKPDVAALEEVVVVGYGTQKKKEVTGAVGFVSDEIIAKAPVSDLGTALQGQVAGVNIQAASGRPGEPANVQIRGLGSVSSNALGPLYVVDGIPFQGTPNIAPEQIQSVDILKDGAAAAIYGTRASNGVILITTKKGVQGKMKIDFSAYAGIQNITSGTPLMNARQQMYAQEVSEEALGTDPQIFFFNPDAFEYDSDFVGAIQNDNAPISNYNLNLSGGTGNLTLNLNTNYFNQDGVLVNSSFNRLTNRINATYTKGKFKAFAAVAFTQENREQEPFALYEYSIGQAPWQPPLNGLRNVGANSVEIPVRNAIYYSYLSRELENTDEREVNSSNIALNLEYELLAGLTYKLNLGRNTWDYKRKFFRPQYLVYDNNGLNASASRPDAILNEDFIWTERQVIENMVTYNKSFGYHNFNILGVLSYEKFESKQLGTGVIGLLSNDTPVLGAGSEGIKPSSFDYTNAISGKLIRLQYNYAGRYLLSASFRRDGSSNFGSDSRYGNFKGISAGWNISDENFFKNANLNAVNTLKLRVSWAEVGNQNIDAYTFASQIESG
ncbi:MAG: SusC/RagA family TonB-linked outer membrane protein, partial [Bacteroidota bacterium]